MNSLTTSGLNTDLAELPNLIGARLGPTEWVEATQEQVNCFAELTGDRNFLHVDPERARSTPFGGTIAHGFLSLSMLAPVFQLLRVDDATMSVNYGLDKVRFPAPLRVGARWRSAAQIIDVVEIDGGVQATLVASAEIEGSTRPAVVAECLIRFYA